VCATARFPVNIEHRPQLLHLHLPHLCIIGARIAMDNPAPQPADDSDAPDDSRSISEAVTTGSWESYSDSEASNEDSDEREVDSLADEEYWEEDTAADAWLARYPGGTRLLYPQLFVVKPRGGKVMTPSRHPNRTDSLLRLPSEIRNRIYRHYFDRDEEVKRPEERHAPFRDRDGMEMQRIRLSSENVELKFWLSTALLQTSRQLRFEAMFILFSNRVITVEWLLVLPRFIEFLGKEGCAMVRYLDIWDTLNLQGDNSAGYRDIITSIVHFSRLQHLRIVLSWDIHSRLWSDRTHSWFDANEWTHDGTLTKHAVPKMRSEDIERHWPEYEVLKNLKAQKFTLAVETIWADRYLEFDRNHGAYPGISKSIQSHPASTQSVPSPAPVAKAIEIQLRSRAFTPSAEFDDEDSDSPTWQDTDTLANKTIPLYNFLRKFFHNNISLWPLRGEMPVDNFVAFPTARKSTGSIMRDCAFCYLSERHCGHHAVPNQPPFEPKRREGDGGEENAKTLETRFEDLSYVDMREACRDVAQQMEDANAPELFKVFAIFDYLGWFETPNSELLARLDAAVDVGWRGKRVDKDEVPPWDVLYREVRSRSFARRNALYSI
jgi:hypothetical protein